MRIFDLLLFLLLTLGTVVFGFLFSRKKQSADEYTNAGGRIPGFVVGLSIFASFCSSISFLGYVASSYSGDWNQFVFTLSILPAGLIAMWFFVPFYRNLGSISAYSYLETRFGRWARIYASVFYLFTQICRSAAILYMLALPMGLLMDWNLSAVITGTGLAILAYAQRGGMRTVIWTEALQGLILVAGALMCLLVVVSDLPHGFEQIIHTGIVHHKFSLGSMGLSLTESTFWVCLFYGLFTNLNNFGVDQSYTQRYSAAPTLREARKSAFWGSLIPVPVNLMLFFIGTAIFTFYKEFPYSAPTGIKVEDVFPYFIYKELPTGLMGAMLACIFCAGMSTIATSITSSATIIVTDFWDLWEAARHKTTEAYEVPEVITKENLELTRAIRHHNEVRAEDINRRRLHALHLSSLLVGLGGIAVAIAFQWVDDKALDAWWKLSSLFSGGVLGLFLLGIVCPRAKNPQAILGITAGVLSLVLIGFQTPICRALGIPTIVHINLAIVISTTLVFLIGFLAIPKFWKKKAA